MHTRHAGVGGKGMHNPLPTVITSPARAASPSQGACTEGAAANLLGTHTRRASLRGLHRETSDVALGRPMW